VKNNHGASPNPDFVKVPRFNAQNVTAVLEIGRLAGQRGPALDASTAEGPSIADAADGRDGQRRVKRYSYAGYEKYIRARQRQ